MTHDETIEAIRTAIAQTGAEPTDKKVTEPPTAAPNRSPRRHLSPGRVDRRAGL